MRYSLPISSSYRQPIFEAVAIQVLLGFLSLMVLDGGTAARFCGLALLAFWAGAIFLIWRRPLTPTKIDLILIRLGYLPVIALTLLIGPLAAYLREILI
jgi:hypothetical protein